MGESGKRGYNYSINGLRFILVCFVVWNHCVLSNPPLGFFAVVSFFAISGIFFCRKGYLSFSDFTKSIKKIFPHHFIALTLYLGMIVLQKKIDITEYMPSYLSYLTFTSMWLPYWFCEMINEVDWFLSAYVWSFLFLILLYKVNNTTRYVLLSLYLLILIISGITTSSQLHFFHFYAPMRFLDIAWGFLIYKAVANERINRYLKPMHALIASLILIVVSFMLYSYVYDIVWIRCSFIFFVPVFLLLYSVYKLDEQDCMVKRFLSNKFIQKGGDLSMGIFLYHFAIAKIILIILPDLHPFFIFIIVLIVAIVETLFWNYVVDVIKRRCFE